jgi:CHAD domain-containing protein
VSLDAKWSEGLTPSMPVVEAAQAIFTARFDNLLKRWREAEAQPHDPEAIHHLRVASRRATAAMSAFGDLMPRRQLRSLRRQARDIRSAAGAVRDRDVFLEQLDEWANIRDEHERPGLDFLRSIWTHVRQRRYQRLAPKLRRHESCADMVATLELRGGRKATLGHRAFEVIPDSVLRLSAVAGECGNDATGLHAVRIIGKRLRYTIELFAGCFPRGQLDTPYVMLEELQDLLGAVHDAEVNACRVQRELALVHEKSRYRPGIEAWLTHLQEIEAIGPKRLSEWLSRWPAVAPQFCCVDVKNS